MTAVADFERLYVKPRPGRTLIVGSFVVPEKDDRRHLYQDALGVDMRAGPGVDRVVDMEEQLNELGMFDHVECISVLEHARRPWLIAENIERVLKPNGTLYVTAPFAWRIHNHPSDYFRFTVDGIKGLFKNIRWERIMYAHTKLSDKTMSIVEGEHRYFARTEVVGCGIRM